MQSIPKRLSNFSKNEVSQLFKTATRGFKNGNLDILLVRKKYSMGRILAIIPARIAPAHLRNTIRRRLKAIFYEEKLFNLGFDFIVIMKTKGLHLSFTQLKELILHGIQHAINAIKEPKIPS